MLEGDPALACWTVQWLSHALLHEPRHLFAGNTFYPYPHAILLSDPMLTLAVLNLPIALLTSNPWIGYNLLIVVSYVWSCVSGAALARLVTQSEIAAFWGGLFWGFLFYRVHHIGHIQVLSFQWMPIVIVCLVRLWQRPGVRAAAALALAFTAQALVGWYLAVATGVAAAIVALTRPMRETLAPRLAAFAAFAAALAAMVIAPIAWTYRQAFGDSTLAARRVLASSFGDAVTLRDYLMPPDATIIGARLHTGYSIWGENTLYIGMVPLALAAIGVASWRRRDVAAEAARWTAAGVALVASGFLLALGFASPRLHLTLPLGYAAKLLPPLAGLRATQRMSLLLYLGILILSSMGVARIARRSAARSAAIVAAMSALFLIEVFPANLPFGAAGSYAASAPDRFIAAYQKTRSDRVVVLHVPIYYFAEPYPIDEARYMVDSTAHWGNIVNGFSGAEPNGFLERMRMLRTLPAPGAIALLRQLGVDVLAVHGSAAADGVLADFFSRQPWAHVIRLPTQELVILLDRLTS